VKGKYSYNGLTLVVFVVLLLGAFSFFSFADDTNLTLFDDFDRDGVSNGEESSYGTDPTNSDTDHDGYSDGVEIESGYNPLVPAPGDRIVQADAPKQIVATQSQTNNVTQKVAENVVSYLADAQESGDKEITSEDFSKVMANAVNEEVVFTDVPPIDISEFTVKNQDYDDLSKREKEEQMKQDAIEYFTAVSYVFISNFPNGFFDRSPETFQAEVMKNMNNFSGSLTSYAFFESMAENAIAAEKQMNEVEVPEEMLEIHTQGIYLLRYMETLYQDGSYKKSSTDITPMIATLAQAQGLIEKSSDFQTKVTEKLQKYGIEDTFLKL
jgi:hypothetical protein